MQKRDHKEQEGGQGRTVEQRRQGGTAKEQEGKWCHGAQGTGRQGNRRSVEIGAQRSWEAQGLEGHREQEEHREHGGHGVMWGICEA